MSTMYGSTTFNKFINRETYSYSKKESKQFINNIDNRL